MQELLEFAFSGINIVPTVLMIFVIIYWLIVILGVVDIDSIDFDLDMDMDIDADVDMGGMSSVLAFFNIGHMPLMVFVTFFSLPLWAITLLVNDFWGGSSLLISLAILLGTAFVSLFIAKFLTIPIAKFYRRVKENTEAVVTIVGKICTAKLPITPEQTAQAEIKVNGTSVLINVRTREGFSLEKGSTALVIDYNEAQKVYYVEPYNL
ncbi:MAG: DUF1449 family protein [Ekhidna sp.]|nr:DUF1449 family protein [Ekhidna sp.]